MIYLIAAAILIIGYVVAQDPDCDYQQNVSPNVVYYINNNYSAGRTCRYIAYCPAGYNCRVDCILNMATSTNCNGDRFLISRSGDPGLAGAEAYCGRRALTAVSINTTLSIGLIARNYGGSYMCNLTAQIAPTPPPPICRCGEKKQTRIVGGQETKVNEYPMMAGIIENAIDSIHCGGTIISSFYILTAAHCVDSFRRNPAALSVVVGAHNIEDSRSGRRYNIARFIIHENYNPNTYDYDIALILVQTEMQFSETVQPACLPFKFENSDLTGRPLTLLGWGTTQFGGPTSEVLRKVDVNIISQSQCRVTEGNVITDRQVCTNATGKDACQFDSGGPGLLTDTSSGFLHIYGTISNGNLCGSRRPGINTRIPAFLRWIVNNANAQFCIKR